MLPLDETLGTSERRAQVRQQRPKDLYEFHRNAALDARNFSGMK